MYFSWVQVKLKYLQFNVRERERSLTANSFDSYALIIGCEDFSGIIMALINAKKIVFDC